MNASAERRALMIGIGNPLRGDDGLGWVIADQLKHQIGDACTILTVHQILPELADQVARAHLAILIDASVVGQPGAFRFQRIRTGDHSSAQMTHDCTPETLVALTTALYGKCPPLYILTLTGENFEMGERLSPIVALRIPYVINVMRRLCLPKSDRD